MTRSRHCYVGAAQALCHKNSAGFSTSGGGGGVFVTAATTAVGLCAPLPQAPALVPEVTTPSSVSSSNSSSPMLEAGVLRFHTAVPRMQPLLPPPTTTAAPVRPTPQYAVAHALRPQRPMPLRHLFACDLCGMTYTTERSRQRHRSMHERVQARHWAALAQGHAFMQRWAAPDDADAHTDDLFRASHEAAERIVEGSKQCQSSPSSPSDSAQNILLPILKPALFPVAGGARKGAKRPFACDRPGCDKRFVTSLSLKRHMRVHSGERPFPCPVCHQRFGTLSHQKRHMRTHTGERPFSCDECNQCFSTSASLKRHKALPFCCKICFKRFSLADGLERHMFKHQ